MSNLVTVAEMKALEAAADQAGVSLATLMENAGRAVAEAVLARVEDPAQEKAVVICGAGNNGGDGMVAAHYLANAGMTVAVYFTRRPAESDPNLQRLRARALFMADAENDQRWRVLKNLLGGATVLLDAVFGTGARLPIAGVPLEVLNQARVALRERARQPFIVAVDCPSGMNCDTGELDSAALPADLTVTFAAAKRGHFAFPAADALGELVIADIGIPASLPENEIKLQLASPAEVRALLPPRPRHAHKGTFGRALIAAGSVNYTGAAYLAAAAAYRLGAGLVTLAVPQPIYPILAAQLPEATWLVLPSDTGVIAAPAAEVLRKEFSKASALLIGPGFGVEKTTGQFLQRMLLGEDMAARKTPIGFVTRSSSAGSAPPSTLPPLVVDADGLRLLAQMENWPNALPANTVLTPHPGEMAALTGLSRDELQADRIAMAQRFATEWRQVVVLKGAFSVIAAPDGRATVLPVATSALARAGTGDVLAGAIVGLLAQGLQPYEAAVTGAYVHARAGELAARALGTLASVMASDVLEGLAEALAEMD